MKWVFRLVLLIIAGWSGYWFIGARAQESLYANLLAESRAEGWTAESRNLGVRGFPSRFDTTLTALNFRDPSGKWGWQAEEFRIVTQSYQLNHMVAAWMGEQVINTPAGEAKINAEQLRASVVVSPSIDLPLERLQLEGAEMALSGKGWTADIGTLNAALFQNEETSTQYRFGVDMENITPPTMLTSILGGGAFLPDIVDKLRLSGQVYLDREIDRLSLASGAPPKPLSVTIEPSFIIWGPSELQLSGELRAGLNGYVDGYLSFEVQNWQPLYDVFAQASNLTTTEKLTLKRALDGASNGQNLVFTLNFVSGETRIGPFTIGPAPVNPF